KKNIILWCVVLSSDFQLFSPAIINHGQFLIVKKKHENEIS
ncbi:MAG: hypothetical protein ACI8RD_012288, partial [Bacillariaceae sp.]